MGLVFALRGVSGRLGWIELLDGNLGVKGRCTSGFSILDKTKGIGEGVFVFLSPAFRAPAFRGVSYPFDQYGAVLGPLSLLRIYMYPQVLLLLHLHSPNAKFAWHSALDLSTTASSSFHSFVPHLFARWRGIHSPRRV